jgi:signal transduction histidine kinase
MELDTNTTREAFESLELLNADVLGTVSHELRGPLTAIKGYAATLLRHERHLARAERRQFLQAINEASDRLEVIIERLLEVSQLESGQVILQLSPVDMNYLVGEAITAIEERVASKLSGHFTFHVLLKNADGTPAQSVPLVLADPRRLREVLDNLLDNAVQYSPEGGQINVVVRSIVQTPNNMLEICVYDEGLGIPTDHLERIFNRFHRVDTRLIREANGLGLGLAICKYIVELHHGSIWAESNPEGKGSVFHLRLLLIDTTLI